MESHQRYLERNPMGYCNHVLKFNWDDVEGAEKNSASVNQMIGDNKVMVFSKSYCPFCHETKAALKDLGVDYKVIELDQVENGDSMHDALKVISGQNTVPQTYIDGQHIGGNSDLQK